uniref:VWFA domain-containing protein n=1 Tax=Aegilops tauschii subsp. strangulata TaxID=200361 RepID=A0A453SGI0_AEGTS
MEKKAPKPSYNSAYGYGNSSTRSNSRYATAPLGLSPWYASSAGNNVQQPEAQATLQRKYSRIGDDYRTVAQVTEALAQAGLESSNLIVGIDFTKSNQWTGKNSYNRRCLHDIGRTPNPYEQAISIIGRTLSDFDEDNLIPCFGFGDASTHDKDVFSFYPENRPCTGFEEALERYRQIVPTLRLSGPTSFAPIIETAIGIVDSTGGQYHVLLIIADGQVTRNVDTQSGQLSPQEWDTINAIVKASHFPLSIVLVGVGDGPWDMMHKFDDNIPARSFDNFQFVNFTEIMSKSIAADRKEAEFALSALMEIPTQYKATLDLQLLGRRQGIPPRVPLPPPARTAYSRWPTNKWVSAIRQFQTATAWSYKEARQLFIGKFTACGYKDTRHLCIRKHICTHAPYVWINQRILHLDVDIRLAMTAGKNWCAALCARST